MANLPAPIVLIMGPPGAGKGTQAQHIVDEYSLRHLATGDVLRDAVSRNTELGRQAKSYMDAGQLVPDEVIIDMLRELICDLPDDQGVLLDGFPRTFPQATALDGMLEDLDRRIDLVIDMRVPHDRLVERLSARWICRDCQRPYNVDTHPPKEAGTCDVCGGELFQRADDTSEAVARRLEVYEEQTAPVSGFYRSKGVLCVINGDRSMDEVQASIDDELVKVMQERTSA